MGKVEPGIYRHFKGHEAEVVCVAKYSEDPSKEYVVYSHPDPKTGEVGWWVRPLEMFLEEVEVEGQRVPRFEYLGPKKH